MFPATVCSDTARCSYHTVFWAPKFVGTIPPGFINQKWRSRRLHIRQKIAHSSPRHRQATAQHGRLWENRETHCTTWKATAQNTKLPITTVPQQIDCTLDVTRGARGAGERRGGEEGRRGGGRAKQEGSGGEVGSERGVRGEQGVLQKQ